MMGMGKSQYQPLRYSWEEQELCRAIVAQSSHCPSAVHSAALKIFFLQTRVRASVQLASQQQMSKTYTAWPHATLHIRWWNRASVRRPTLHSSARARPSIGRCELQCRTLAKPEKQNCGSRSVRKDMESSWSSLLRKQKAELKRTGNWTLGARLKGPISVDCHFALDPALFALYFSAADMEKTLWSVWAW